MAKQSGPVDDYDEDDGVMGGADAGNYFPKGQAKPKSAFGSPVQVNPSAVGSASMLPSRSKVESSRLTENSHSNPGARNSKAGPDKNSHGSASVKNKPGESRPVAKNTSAKAYGRGK